MRLIGFIIIYPLLWLLSILPLNFLYFISDTFLYPIVYYLIKYRRNVVFSNLRNAFPEKNNDEIKKIGKKFYKYFCHVLVETIKLLHIPEQEFKERIKFRNANVLDELYSKGKSIIAVTGHYGNWEWLSGVADRTPYKIVSLYKPLSNKYIEKVLTEIRTRFGAELVAMNQTIRKMHEYDEKDQKILVCFIADQTPIRSHIEYWTKFLNHLFFWVPKKLPENLIWLYCLLKLFLLKRDIMKLNL